MKVGILGSGDVGRTLATGFASRGHDVKVGSRDPKKPELAKWLRETRGKTSTGSPSETAAQGEVIVLATLGPAAEEAMELAWQRNFDGKVMIDVTNPLDFAR